MSGERYSQPVVKFHHPTATGSPVPLVPDAEGAWVSYEDFEATQQQLDQLLEAVKELREAEDPRVHYGALKRTCQVAREIEKERKS